MFTLVITTLQPGLQPSFSYRLRSVSNCIRTWRAAYSLKSTPNDSLLRNFSRQFSFALRVLARNLLREGHRGNIFHISVSFIVP